MSEGDCPEGIVRFPLPLLTHRPSQATAAVCWPANYYRPHVPSPFIIGLTIDTIIVHFLLLTSKLPKSIIDIHAQFIQQILL